MSRGIYGNILKSMVLCIALCIVLFCLPGTVRSQSGLYVPSAKSARNIQKSLVEPEVFQLLIVYGDAEENYPVEALDLLDSAYRIAFDVNNPKLYTMTIESYGDADNELARHRADAVFHYFAMRSSAQFPIRYANNRIHCSCTGDTVELLRFEVPVQTMVYDVSELPSTRRILNGTVNLDGSVLVTFRNNPDECVGAARGCAVPSADSTVMGYYSSLLLAKGSLYSVENTKDTCPTGFSIKIEDHLDYRTIVEQYKLIPHRKQLLVQAGYIVYTGEWPVKMDSCSEALKDSIVVRVPVTQEQLDAKLKFFAKVRTSKGVEYKQLPTRKVPGRGQLALQAALNAWQLDTVFLGVRIKDNDLGKYFYKVDNPTEASAFKVGNHYYVASRPGKKGELVLKKALKALFRIIPEQEEEEIKPSSVKDIEEIIE